jgi:hypothetical protein
MIPPAIRIPEKRMMVVIPVILAVLVLQFAKTISKSVFLILRQWLTRHRATTLKIRLTQQKETRTKILLNYSPIHCEALNRFSLSKAHSPCLFAKQAQLWGSCEYERDKSLTQNIVRNVPALCKFASIVEDNNQTLDGFLIEIRGIAYSDTVASFAATVRTALAVLSQHDPSGLDPMQMLSINTSSWNFSFDMVPMFVTTFAPCYPPSSARYLHLTESASDSCFILLQPEVSFLRHGIGPDQPVTNWEKPHTIRDKIRANFRDKQKSYHIPSSLNYPVAATFVHSEDGKSNSVPFWDKCKYPDLPPTLTEQEEEEEEEEEEKKEEKENNK